MTSPKSKLWEVWFVGTNCDGLATTRKSAVQIVARTKQLAADMAACHCFCPGEEKARACVVEHGASGLRTSQVLVFGLSLPMAWPKDGKELEEFNNSSKALSPIMEAQEVENRNRDVDHLISLFKYEHLPPRLAAVSEPFAKLALEIASRAVNNPETAMALRKLLEAKDCAVRAAL